MKAFDFANRRRALGLTQTALSKISGYAILTISSWETGRRPVPQRAAIILDLLSKLNNPASYEPPK